MNTTVTVLSSVTEKEQVRAHLLLPLLGLEIGGNEHWFKVSVMFMVFATAVDTLSALSMVFPSAVDTVSAQSLYLPSSCG